MKEINMLVIENISRLINYPDYYVSVVSANTTANNTYEIKFFHTEVIGWTFTYVIHRDMDNGEKYVGTLRYENRNGAGLPWASHREDCLHKRLKTIDAFLHFLNILIDEWKVQNNID
jgi:hypothetical protein